MRRWLVLAAAIVASAGVAAVADAVVPVTPTVTASPAVIKLGSPTLITGDSWPVNEFCQRTIKLKLRSAQNAAPIGTVRVRDGGGFSRGWTPQADKVGAGTWKLVARMRCESGKDGSAIWIVKSTTVRLAD